MQKSFSILLQYLLPQHTLSRLLGRFAESRHPRIKNWMIGQFIKHYPVNMKEAMIENPFDYPSFNSFFTRYLKPELRPIQLSPSDIASPVDGSVSQIGRIEKNQLLQAKGHYFTLVDLLGGYQKYADYFSDGQFATFYLAPKDYHRVHMPFKGKLNNTVFIPGKLFSVNTKTTEAVPNLFARNERLVCLFDTSIGPMAVIFVGAMIVGSINTMWNTNTQGRDITVETYADAIEFSAGAEIGHFKMGSTVIVLFSKNQVAWIETLRADSIVRMGQMIGKITT